MEYPYRPEMVEEAGRHLDEVVARIEANDFHILSQPESGIWQQTPTNAAVSERSLTHNAKAVS